VPLAGAALRTDFDLDMLQPMKVGWSEENSFPAFPELRRYESLQNAITHSIDLLLGSGNFDTEKMILSVLASRLVVAPGAQYGGFFHRDLQHAAHRVGTVLWYPQVRHSVAAGLNFVARWPTGVHSIDPSEEKAAVDHTVMFSPDKYELATIVLPYPLNAPHGVQPMTVDGSLVRTDDISFQQIALPPPHWFVKDLVLVTVSNQPIVDQ
jgi:hypothetical protein